VCDRTTNAIEKQPILMKLLWAGHPARPKNTNMTFMNLISEFNELTLTKIS
jgi:purine-nucleoside phosphorylase